VRHLDAESSRMVARLVAGPATSPIWATTLPGIGRLVEKSSRLDVYDHSATFRTRPNAYHGTKLMLDLQTQMVLEEAQGAP
jgi:hypothetical protein